jgi:uncharacterized protein YkwD
MKKLIVFLFPFIAFTQVDNVKLQQDFVKELNAYRVSKGLNTVSIDNISNIKAARQANYCVSINTLTHDYPEFKGVYAECALFQTTIPTAKNFLNIWINSPEHNKLLLLPDVTSIGIYYVPGLNNNHTGYYAVLVLQP